MRLIDADALIQEIDAQCPDYKRNGIGCIVKGALNDCIKIIKRQPTIEAAPVVHGKWVDNGERDMSGVPKPFAISCSVCGSSAGTYWMKYCPNCGAKMDGKAV